MLIALALLGCAAEAPSDSAIDAVDLTLDYPEPDEGGMQLEAEAVIVPAYSDETRCQVMTYEGPDVGVVSADFFQNGEFGHHVIALKTNVPEHVWEDGREWLCNDTASYSMGDTEPLILPMSPAEGRDDEVLAATMELHDGVALELETGTRLLFQVHHINTTPDPVLVNSAININTVPIDEVEQFGAPFAHTDTEFELPPNQESTVSFTCAFEQDVTFVNLFGHMHEWGKSFSLDYLPVDGEEERIYEIEEWDVWMRDAPPIDVFEPGEFEVQAGDAFRTTCDFDNDTDEVLTFPFEMCVSVGMVYPTKAALYCVPDEEPVSP